MIKLRLGNAIPTLLVAGFTFASSVHAAPITWVDMSPTAFGSTPPNASVYLVPGVGPVTLTYTSPPDMSYTRSFLPSSVVGSVGVYSWTNYEYFGSIYNGTPLGPQNFTVTYTFPLQPAGTVFVGTIGLGATTEAPDGNGGLASGASTTTVNQNATFIGDYNGGDGFAPTQFIGGPGTFTAKNSTAGPGGSNPWWNSQLAVIRIDDAVSSITVNQANLRGDGIGVNIGFLNQETPTHGSTWGRIKKMYR